MLVSKQEGYDENDGYKNLLTNWLINFAVYFWEIR